MKMVVFQPVIEEQRLPATGGIGHRVRLAIVGRAVMGAVQRDQCAPEGTKRADEGAEIGLRAVGEGQFLLVARGASGLTTVDRRCCTTLTVDDSH
jgi:hypothetical protein